MIQKIGLCICLYDILKASDGLIGHGTGIVNVNGRDLFPIFNLGRKLVFQVFFLVFFFIIFYKSFWWNCID